MLCACSRVVYSGNTLWRFTSYPQQSVPLCNPSYSYSAIIMTESKPYKGNNKKLVLSLDIGTTFSGMSYVLLDPGQAPKIEPVKR